MSNQLPEIPILYEDADCLAVNKPAGLMVHPDGRTAGPFLTDWILLHYPDAASVGEPARGLDGGPIARPGIVHRLDRDTSGVLIVAKTARGHAHLKSQFQDRTVSKKYMAVVWGEMKEEFGTITRPIGRSGSDFRKWSAQRGMRGETREAETYWTKIKNEKVKIKNGSQESEEWFSLVEVEPKTGRTHQIRVHMLAIHHPVVSDTLYAPKRSLALGFARTALHARSIEFETVAGKRVRVEAPFPEDFQRAMVLLGVSM